MNRFRALVWTIVTAWPLATANANADADADAAAARDSIVDPPVVYTVKVDGPPEWAIAVSATFPGSPDSVMMSTWSSFAFPEGWSALVRDVVAVKDGARRPLPRGPDGTWNPGTSDDGGPLTIEYTVELAPVFAEYESLPKTTAPWTDGHSLVIPGFCLFMHAPGQSRFVLQFEVPEGARVDTGWSDDASDGSFRGASREELLQNTCVVGRHRAAEVETGGFHVTAVPLGRHRDGIDELGPVIEAHARRFQSLFDYPTEQRYLMVLNDDPWETGESYHDSFAMSDASPIGLHNRLAWGKTIAHELFHYWNGSRMKAADWAASQWFSEGTTDYIASRAMVDGGFMTADELFDELQKHVSFYELFKQGIVYDDLSIVDAGTRKTSHNAAVYDGGWLIAFCLDVIIREQTSNEESIESMMRRLWDQHGSAARGRPFSNEDVISIGESIGGPEVRRFFERYVAGKERIPLGAFCARAGLQLVLDAQLAWIRPIDDASPSARLTRASVAGVAPVDAEPLQDRIERFLAPLASDTTPGAVVVVTHEGRVIAEHAVGMANLEHGVPLDADSVFHVASDAKRFTAAAICRLAERGHLALDDLVSEHIPEAAPLGQRITIEQLLCHSSGIKDQWSLLAMAGWRPEDIVVHEQVVDMLCRQRSTNFEPGDRQMYSNSGYTLLAEIVSRVTGTGLGDFLEREFFVPSGMTRTRLRTSVSEVVPGRVESYLPAEDGTYVRRPVQYEVLGATSLLTTARDLSRWIDAVHAADGALSRIELETMLSPRRLPGGDVMTYAFGLFEHQLHNVTAIGHGGADGGFRSYFLRVPERRLGVVVLANTPKIEPNGLAHRIAEWALGFEPPPADDASSDEHRPPDLSRFVSTYRDADGHVVTVRKWFDKLRLWEGGAPPAEFTWRMHDERFVDPAGRVLGFDDGHCHVTTGGRTWTGARNPGPDAEALRECVGVYISEELGAMLELTVEDAVLVARSPRGPRITLTPSGRDFFDGDAWYCFEARVTRDPEGRVHSLLLSSSRAFDVPFIRQPGK